MKFSEEMSNTSAIAVMICICFVFSLIFKASDTVIIVLGILAAISTIYLIMKFFKGFRISKPVQLFLILSALIVMIIVGLVFVVVKVIV